MNNSTDKNGNTIKIGDRIVYMKGTPDEDYGVVTNMSDKRYELWAKWSDGSELYIEPSEVELVSTVTTDTFTKEDEAMLQLLLAKKEKEDKLRVAADESLTNLVENFYAAASDCGVRTFIVKNIDSICDTLQEYKRVVNN